VLPGSSCEALTVASPATDATARDRASGHTHPRGAWMFDRLSTRRIRFLRPDSTPIWKRMYLTRLS
jgi:hypothetical protein